MTSAYADITDFKRYAFQPGTRKELLHEDVLLRASRTIDLLCDVEPGYFGLSDVGTRTFLGDGTQYLQLDRYAAGSITFVEYVSGQFAPNYIEKDGFLVAINGQRWCDGEAVEVTANWGFESIPDEIIEAALELAIAIWRQSDSAFLRAVADANGVSQSSISGQAVPERVKLICEKWKRRKPVVIC